MNTNEVGNIANQTMGPMDSSVDREASAVPELTASVIATIWRGQEQLRQHILTANSLDAYLSNICNAPDPGAGSARNPEVAAAG